MLLGIMSDVHCNAAAMGLALDHLTPTVDEVLLAGDAVLQYRFSNEVIESIRDHGITYIAGNHEMTLLSEHGNGPGPGRTCGRATLISWRMHPTSTSGASRENGC